MDIQLTSEELQREQNLFAPSKTLYKPLKGKAFDIRTFVKQVNEGDEDDDIPLPPSSC